MKTNPNDPAQPTIVGTSPDVIPQVGSSTWHMPGLTIRETMAMAAMQGILATMSPGVKISKAASEHVANEAIQCADALIEALNKGGE